jgi:hypothetical protein
VVFAKKECERGSQVIPVPYFGAGAFRIGSLKQSILPASQHVPFLLQSFHLAAYFCRSDHERVPSSVDQPVWLLRDNGNHDRFSMPNHRY